MARAAGPVKRFAPGPDGELVLVEVISSRRPAPVRRGPFAVWDDLCEAARHTGGLSSCVRYILEQGGADSYEEIVYFRGGYPQPLRPAEREAVRRLRERRNEYATR